MADFGTLESIPIELASYRERWNVQACEYKLDGAQSCFADIVLELAAGHAATLEAEVAPLATRMRKRNARLNDLGKALACVTKLQSLYASEAKDGEPAKDGKALDGNDAELTVKILIGYDSSLVNGRVMSRANVERAIQLLKTEIDRLNNESSMDSARLQSLVDNRDQSFSTASSMSSAINDTIVNAIRGMQ